MFHVGHLRLLQSASKLCDILVVGITTDELCKEIKKKKPVVSFEHRMEIVKGLSCVDVVIAQNEMDKEKTMKKLHADVCFVGDDHWDEEDWMVYEDNFKVVYLPYTVGVSSTCLRKKII